MVEYYKENFISHLNFALKFCELNTLKGKYLFCCNSNEQEIAQCILCLMLKVCNNIAVCF